MALKLLPLLEEPRDEEEDEPGLYVLEPPNEDPDELPWLELEPPDDEPDEPDDDCACAAITQQAAQNAITLISCFLITAYSLLFCRSGEHRHRHRFSAERNGYTKLGVSDQC